MARHQNYLDGLTIDELAKSYFHTKLKREECKQPLIMEKDIYRFRRLIGTQYEGMLPKNSKQILKKTSEEYKKKKAEELLKKA